MAQTTMTAVPSVAFAGLLAENSGKMIRTYLNAEGAAIPFGVAVQLDSTGVASLPDSSSDKIVGIAVHAHAYEQDGLTGDLGIPNGERFGVLRKGIIWVICEDGCVEGDPAFYRHADAGALGLGALRTDADTADATALAGCEFISTAAVGGLALLLVDL